MIAWMGKVGGGEGGAGDKAQISGVGTEIIVGVHRCIRNVGERSRFGRNVC